ncbi:MAG: glycosyltransferase [Candidatus Rokuibacteriota bacterium]
MVPATRMEILVLAPYPPYPARSGGASRTLHLARALARHHRVSLLCFGGAVERAGLEPIREWCDAVHTVDYPAAVRRRRLYQLRSLVGRRSYSHHAYFSAAMAGALARLLSRGRVDLVQADASEMGYYWPLPGDALRILNTQNVEHLILDRTWRGEASRIRRLFARLEARKLMRDELAACRGSDAVLAVSAVDAAALRPHAGPVPVRVVPNGVDTEFFTPGGEPEHPGRILFTGAIGYRPNTDATCHFAERILPRIRAAAPDATFAVVGKDPPEQVRRLAGEGVVVTGTVPDVRPWMRTAAVFVVPLRVGGGTRLKILEAMASGRPVVSTSVGCEGLDVTPEEDILVGDTPEAFAAQVLRCLRDPGLRARLGARGRALVERRYRWEAIGDRLAAFYEELWRSRSAAPRARGARPALA